MRNAIEYYAFFIFRSGKLSTTINIQNFRKLQILIIYFNHSFIWILIPFLLCWLPSSLAITNCFSAIRFHNFLPFFEYIPFPTLFNNMIVIISVTMVPAASVLDSSEKMYHHLKKSVTCGRKKILRKELASLHPFGVKIGPIQTIQRVAILMTYYFISNNVFTLLITFPQEVVRH